MLAELNTSSKSSSFLTSTNNAVNFVKLTTWETAETNWILYTGVFILNVEATSNSLFVIFCFSVSESTLPLVVK